MLKGSWGVRVVVAYGVAVIAGLGLAAAVSALPYGSGKYDTCTYDTCAISLTTSGTVALNVSTSGSDAYTIDKDLITINTGASTGYTLQLESAVAATTLAGTGANITATTGTVAAPVTLASNTWGFRLDGQGGFGAGPTSAVTNASSSTLTFAGLTASGAPATIKTTAAAASAEATDVWYGVRVASNLQAGTYSRTVLYTATTNG